MTAALLAADLVASGRYTVAGGSGALIGLLEQMAGREGKRDGSSSSLSVADGLAQAAFMILAAGESVSPEKVTPGIAMVFVFLSTLTPEQAASLIALDLKWLSDWAGQKRAQDGMVGPDFFKRPLWERAEGADPPEGWISEVEEWTRRVEATGPKWLPRMYHALLAGKGPDWKRQGAALSELGEFILQPPEPKEKAETNLDEPAHEDEPTPEDDETLQGGTVTAAADTPALEDRLGRTPLVHTLADMLSSPDQPLPMTIALLGDWGAGKSSVIAQLRKRMEALGEQPGRSRYLVAEFNAWAYEQTDNIQAGLAQEVVRGLTRGLSWWDRLILAVRNASNQHGWGFYRTILYLGGTLLLTALGVYNADKLGELNAMSQSLLGTGGAAVLVFSLVRSWQRLRLFMEHPLAEKLSTYLQLPNYGEHLGQVPVIKEEIRSLCNARLGPNERLLVVVDDLDRCQPTCITETLDAIRLVMDLERAAVILAIDDRIAFRAVAEHYRHLAEDGQRSKEEIARDYLGKIIQLPVNLYEPWHWEVTRFIRDRLFVVEEEEGVEPSPAPPAPAALSSTARALVEKQGLDPSRIPGSGQNGRILKKDVEAFLEMPRAADPGLEDIGTLIDRPDEAEPSSLLGETKPVSSEADTRPATEGPMRDTAFERDLFAELAREMRFHNPRQLIRLRNSYRLLKGYRHNRKSGELSRGLVDSLMHGLFWYEHLYQQRKDRRQHAELILWEWSRHPEWAERAMQQSDSPPVVNMARRLMARLPADDWEREYHRLLRTVEMVVLPNAQMGLLLGRAQADKALSESTRDGEAKPAFDPWRA